MNNALLGLAGLLIAVLTALFAVPYFIDWNGYRGMFEAEASRVLGRDVRVGGAVDVRLLPVPYVSFAKVRVADTANDTGDPFFRADSFTMWLSISPLLRGQLEARRIELSRPVLRLVVDPQGSGNWSTIKAQPGALPFVPANVALQSVRLRDGVVSVVRGQGGVNRGTLAELTGIDGELEAETLDGPFRFKGAARWQEQPREVRVSTSKFDGDGGVRLKASVRVPANGNSYVLDGGVSELRRHPRLDGELTARIALDAAAGESGGGSRSGDLPLLDGKSRVEADGTGLRLREIAATLENVGQPQLVSGEAQMAWVAKPAMEVRLASRLLDLDRIGGRSASASALAMARGMVASVVSLLPAEADSTVGLEVDQATLGGDSLSALSLVLQRLGGQLEMKQMHAGVPGGGRIDLAGKITLASPAAGAPDDKASPDGKPDADGKAVSKDEAASLAKSDGGKPTDALGQPMQLDGDVVLRGTSLARFLAWAAPSVGAASSRPDGPFLLAGRLVASDRSLAIADATAELGAVPLSGSARLDLGARKKITVQLDGRRVDLGQLWPEAFAGGVDTGLLDALLPGLGGRLGLPGAAAPAAGSKSGLVDLATTDIAARITAGELVLGSDVVTEVDADVAIDRGNLSVTNLRGTTAEKLTFDVSGQLAEAGANARGVLRWTASAPSPDAAGALVRLAGIASDAAAGKARFGALAPLRLAGTMGLGQRGERTTDVTLDGSIGGGRLLSRLRSDAEPANWRTAQLDAYARVDGSDALGLLRTALPGVVAAAEPGEAMRRGQLFLEAVGTADKGMTTLASLDGDGLNLTYDGRWQIAAGGRHALDGSWRAKSKDARALLALIGVPVGGGLTTLAVEGHGSVTGNGTETTLAASHVVVGASAVGGRVVLTRKQGATATDTPPRFDADLTVDKASVGGLLAMLASAPAPVPAADPGKDAAPAAAPTAAPTTAPWAAQPIDTRIFDRLDGHVAARFGRLVLEPGLALADVAFDARFAPGRIDIGRLDGVGLGGKIAIKGAIEKAGAGVKVKGRLETDDVNLVALGSPEREVGASGPLKVTLDVAGQGSSAATVVGSLSGRGDVVAGPAEIGGFTPSSLAALAEAAIAGRGERSGEGLATAVRDAVGLGRFKIAATTIPVDIQGGILKTKPLVIESGSGRATLSVVAELESLKFDADWQIEPQLAKSAEGSPGKGPLPPVGVAYVGRLKDLGRIEPRIDLAAFERELDVRRMEHDVEELERLRKLDEERARAEQERQNALEAEREAERQRAAEAERARAAAAAMTGSVETGQTPAAAPPASDGKASTPGAPKASDAKPSDARTGDAKASDATSGDATSGDWKTVETPTPSATPTDDAAKSARPARKPSPPARAKPKPTTLESIFKSF